MSGNVAQVLFLLVICCIFDEVLGVCSVSDCIDATRCVTITGGDELKCKCTERYYGDLCDKEVTINVMCGKDFITVMVNEDFFVYHNVSLESLHLANPMCRGRREVMSGVSYYKALVRKDEYQLCGGKPLQTNVTHISYALTLMSGAQVNGNIVRDPIIKIEYTCVYPYIRTVHLPYPILPLSSDTVLHMDELEARVEMLLYKDQTYAEPHVSSPVVHLRDKVYVEVQVKDPADFFLLRVDECWASQSSQPNDKDGGLIHTLLLNGCVKDETVAFLGTTLNPDPALPAGLNGQDSIVRYSFDMFRFTVEPYDLYLHCTVRLCTPDDGEPCIPECKGISKRAADRGDRDPSRGTLSYGPIRIKAPETAKSSHLMTMVIPVAGIWVLGLFLLIIITIAKAGNRRRRAQIGLH